jgi:hypothetical protein
MNLVSDIWYDSLIGGSARRQGFYLHRTAQHRKTRIHTHASSWIRTHNPNVRAVEDSTCLRPRGHWNRLQIYLNINSKNLEYYVNDDKVAPSITYQVKKTTSGVEVQLHRFVISALDGGEWLISSFDCLTHGTH